jgi:hypothetical protein
MAARALGKLPLSRLFGSHLRTQRTAYNLVSRRSHTRTAPAVLPTWPSTERLTVPAHYDYARTPAKSTATATQYERCRMGARHRRTHRRISLFSDDICDGMLPLRRLVPKSLHLSSGRRPAPDTSRKREMQHCPDSDPPVRPRVRCSCMRSPTVAIGQCQIERINKKTTIAIKTTSQAIELH